MIGGQIIKREKATPRRGINGAMIDRNDRPRVRRRDGRLSIDDRRHKLRCASTRDGEWIGEECKRVVCSEMLVKLGKVDKRFETLILKRPTKCES